jgi:hypothetical protein
VMVVCDGDKARVCMVDNAGANTTTAKFTYLGYTVGRIGA